MLSRIYYFSLYAITVTASVIAYFFVNQNSEMAKYFFSESGPIEKTTAGFFVVACVVAAASFFKQKTNLKFVFLLSMALAAMRELDWHKAWTTDSILKSKFYISDAIPIYEKIIGAVVILLLLYIAISLAFKVKIWVRDLWQGQLISWSVFFALATMVGAKMIDSMTRLLPFMSDFKAEYHTVFLGVEESLEMVSASLFIFTALVLLRQKQANKFTEYH